MSLYLPGSGCLASLDPFLSGPVGFVGSRLHLLCWEKGRLSRLSGPGVPAVPAIHDQAWSLSRLSYPSSGLGSQPSQPSIIKPSRGQGGRMAAGRGEGRIESSPGRSLPSLSTADKWNLGTDGGVCNPNSRRRSQRRGQSTDLFGQQMDRLFTWDPATR